VGYLGYEVVCSFEPIPQGTKEGPHSPLFAFFITDTLLIFDNVAHTIKVVANASISSTSKHQLRRTYQQSINRIDAIVAKLQRSRRRPSLCKGRRRPLTFQSNMTSADFKKMVLRVKEYIQAGDIIQG